MGVLTDRNMIIGLMLLQIAVCLPFINSFPIALDEPFSIFWAQQDLHDMHQMFMNENNPPLHFELLHYWIKLFGISPLAVRSLSLVFSVLTIPFLYKLARKLMEQPFAVLVVLLFVCSRFNHFHALEARTYSLFVFLFVVVVLQLYKLIFEDKFSFWILAVANALLLYSHYLGAFVLSIELVILLFFIRRLNKRKMLWAGAAYLLTVALYIPGISLFLNRFGNFSEKGTWVPEAQYSELYGNIIRFFNNTFTFFAIIGLVIIFMISFREGLVERLKRSFLTSKHLFIIAFFVTTYGGMFVFSKAFQPVFLDRYLLYTTIPLFILTGLIISTVFSQRNYFGAFLIIIPMAISTKWLPDNNRSPDLEAEYISAMRQPGVPILICPPYYDLTILYHLDRSVFSDYENFERRKASDGIQSVYSFEDIEGENTKGVLFLDANSAFVYPGNNLRSSLDSLYRLKDYAAFDGGITIYVYVPG
jgi:4-amino-4-deoxy-L-arabinose transferase-like glycosyltransferase